jgi:hypothetical protein
MIDNRLLSQYSPETANRVREAIGRLDSRQLHIVEKLDQPHRLKYLLADSEAKRMDIHRNYWKETFASGAKTTACMGLVPLATLGVMSVAKGFMAAQGTDVAALGAMSMALAGAGAVTHMLKEKAADIVANHVESKAAKFSSPAMASSFDGLAKSSADAHPAQKLGSLGVAAQVKPSQAETEIHMAVGRIVSASTDARVNGREVSAQQLKEWQVDIADRITTLSKRDPMAARKSAERFSSVLRNYGIEMNVPLANAQSSLQSSGRLAMDA